MLTERDQKLLRLLSAYGMFSTKQVAKYLFNGIAVTTVLRRLRILEEQNYLARLLGLESHELLWVLTLKGATAANVPMPKRHWSKNMLEHDYKLLELRILLEVNGVAHSWTPEHEIRSLVFKNNGIRAAKEKIIPDGIMGIEQSGIKESIAVELELTLKNEKRLDQIIRRYQAKQGIIAVWYISPHLHVLSKVLKIWRKWKSPNNGIKLYVSLLDELMKDPVNARLQGENNPKKICEVWSLKTAQVGAQRVSTDDDKNLELKTEATTENHAPILDIAS